jgi:hypothetical protein
MVVGRHLFQHRRGRGDQALAADTISRFSIKIWPGSPSG